jgi:hypothetical protein
MAVGDGSVALQNSWQPSLQLLRDFISGALQLAPLVADNSLSESCFRLSISTLAETWGRTQRKELTLRCAQPDRPVWRQALSGRELLRTFSRTAAKAFNHVYCLQGGTAFQHVGDGPCSVELN